MMRTFAVGDAAVPSASLSDLYESPKSTYLPTKPMRTSPRCRSLRAISSHFVSEPISS
jgi:hypothetical protein